MSKSRKFHYAVIILLAVSCIRGFAGPAINASSGLFLPSVSNEFGIGIGQLSLYMSISSIVTLIWLPIAGNLINKYSVKTVAIVSVLLQTIAFSAFGYMNSVWGFYLLAIPMAMGGVLLVNLLGPVLINRWFSKNLGLVMGLMMTITSLLGAVFQPILTNLIQGKGWRFTYTTFGAIALATMVLIILFFIVGRPQDKGLQPFGAEASSNDPDKMKHRAAYGITSKRALSSPSFYMLLFFMIVLTAFAVFAQHITNFGLSEGFTLGSIGIALSLMMIGSAIGSILIGILSDKIGIVKTSILVMITAVLSIVLFLLGKHILLVFITATFLHGLATSSIGVVAPLLTTEFFGSKDYERLFSLVMTGSPLASILLVPAYGYIFDHFSSYLIVLIFLIAMLILGALSIFFGKKSSARLLAQEHENQQA